MKVLLDTYCKAGGASMGYHQAGFHVVGLDKDPQPNYPFEFYQSDIRDISAKWLRNNFDIVTGSPPCQFHTTLRHTHTHTPDSHKNLIPGTRHLFKLSGLPYVIENVEGALSHMVKPFKLCGSTFGLRVRRHRLFETNVNIGNFPVCEHQWQARSKVYTKHLSKSRGSLYLTGSVPVHGVGNQLHKSAHSVDDYRFIAAVAMGVDWMTWEELTQAIPPAYTRWIGRKVIQRMKALHEW